MKHIYTISLTEIVSTFRDWRLLALCVIVLSMILVAVFTGYKAYHVQKTDRESAQKEKRMEWENQDKKNPHMAAHFGTFVFKPKSLLSFLDFGVDNYSGTFVYLEAHKQNDFVFKPAQEYEATVRFGDLTGAVVMQIFIPLMIIFLCFGSISAEREQGRLKLLLVQGISLPEIIWGKIIGYFLIIVGVLAVGSILVILILFLLFQSAISKQMLSEFLMFSTLYGIYFFITIAFSVIVSAFSASSKNALLILLSIWVVVAILIPKAMANIGDELFPLPTEVAFKAEIHNDVQKGLDGHNSSDERAKALEKVYLKKHNVDSIHKLPVNFDGILLLQSEEYTSKVYDKHFKELQHTYFKQNSIASYISLINPYLAVRNLSMGVSQTDFYAHLNFQNQAELYRRYFVQKLNNDMATNSKLNEFETYKIGREMWVSIKPFNYSPLTINRILCNYSLEIMSLILWSVFIATLITYSSHQVKIL